MEIADRLKLYTTYADISRRWTAVMDAKGAFLSGLNGAALAFMWNSLKIDTWTGVERILAVAGTACSIVALIAALLVILPREKMSLLVGKRSPWTHEYRPLSFYGYIARYYGDNGYAKMMRDFRLLNEEQFAYEALEQHWAISCVIQRKSSWVFRAGFFTLVSLTCVGTSMLIKLW